MHSQDLYECTLNYGHFVRHIDPTLSGATVRDCYESHSKVSGGEFCFQHSGPSFTFFDFRQARHACKPEH